MFSFICLSIKPYSTYLNTISSIPCVLPTHIYFDHALLQIIAVLEQKFLQVPHLPNWDAICRPASSNVFGLHPLKICILRLRNFYTGIIGTISCLLNFFMGFRSAECSEISTKGCSTQIGLCNSHGKYIQFCFAASIQKKGFEAEKNVAMYCTIYKIAYKNLFEEGGIGGGRVVARPARCTQK